MTWKRSICALPRASSLSGSSFLENAQLDGQVSAIDEFYDRRTELVVLGNEDTLDLSPSLGPLLLVGIVSATEFYLRTIIADCIEICDKSKELASDAPVHLGSALWHGASRIGRGIIEHESLAASKKVITISKKLLSYEIKSPSNTFVALEEFDKVCEIRHGVVHSAGRLPGKNALKLGIAPRHGEPRIKVGHSELQQAIQVCSNLVVSYNTELFCEMSERWALTWRPPLKSDKYKVLWLKFHSKTDELGGLIENPLSWLKCKNRVSSEFT